MNSFVEKKIYLWWQPSQHAGRYIIGEFTQKGEGDYIFRYISGEDLDKEYSENVMESFSMRLPARSRDDFKQLLDYWDINNENIDDFDLLSITGGRLQTDHFGFLDKHELEETTEFLTELAGVHHYLGKQEFNDLKLIKGDEVDLRLESDNDFDPYAVSIYFKNNQLGYIRKGQAKTVSEALNSRKEVKAYVGNFNVNGVINSVLIRVVIS